MIILILNTEAPIPKFINIIICFFKCITVIVIIEHNNNACMDY